MNDRARVPFALLGVLLLVSSAALAPALQRRHDTGDPDVDVAMDRLTGEVQTAIRDGIESGARAAGRNPVTTPANTTVGRVLEAETAFRDSLALRIHAAVRERLERTRSERRGIELTASLPRPENATDLRRVLRRTDVSRAGPNGTNLRVSLANVTLTARRGDRVVGQKRLSPTIVTPNPVLAVHDRVDRFEELLNAGPIEPGLGRRLTGSLYGVTWARGYAQYANLPIENVVANRHLSLLSNHAVLRLQDRVFGESDPVARATFVEMLAVTGVLDVLGVIAPKAKAVIQDVREAKRTVESLDPGGAEDALDGEAGYGQPTDEKTVRVNETADQVFVEVLGSVYGTVEEIFTADVRLVARNVHRSGGLPDRPAAPRGDGWSRVDTTNRTTADVTDGTIQPETPSGRWHRLAAYPRRVELTHERTARFERGTRTEERTTTSTETVSFSLQVEGFHANGEAPAADLVGFHEPGGPLGGENFATLRERAIDRLVTAAGGPDSVAAEAARRDWNGTRTRLQGHIPDDVHAWIYRDVATLRDRIRNLSVTTTLGSLATHQATPADDLAEDLRARTEFFVDAPTAYESVSSRARYAIRHRFVTETVGALVDRANARSQRRSRLNVEMLKRGGTGLATLQAAYQKRNQRAQFTPLGLDMRVDAAPAYLSQFEVSASEVGALRDNETLHPLAVRNLNLFTLPYDGAADLIAKVLSGPKRVAFKTGVDVLGAHRRLREIDEQAANGMDIGPLRAELEGGLGVLADNMGRFLSNQDSGFPGDRHAWAALVRAALGTYSTTLDRSTAVLDESLAERVAEKAASEWPGTFETGTWKRDYLELRSRQFLRAAASSNEIGPRRSTTNGTVTEARSVIQDELSDRLAGTMQNATMEALRGTTNKSWPRQPAGLPVVPTFTPWLVTVNTWKVEVGGEYARFAVRVPRGSPVDPGGSFAYVRDGERVRADLLPGAGPEHLGNASRISFHTGTWIGIAVPAGGVGVGDVDGVQDETSPGWPPPGE